MSILRSRIILKPYQLFLYYFLLEKVPNCDLSNLQFDTNIRTTVNKLRHHKWHLNDILHYGFLSSVIFFVFVIFPASFLIKLPILMAFITCFLIPLTSQFFVHALPIFCYLALFFTCGKIPQDWKPAISVKFLPALETIFYGDNLSNVLAAIQSPVLDLIAWFPYGILHFAFPFVVAIFIFVFGPPTSLNSFGFAFGYMNLLGVMLQLSLPAAPPWYKNLHGLEPANYSMMGSPGGLGRIDEIFGFDMYTTAFSNSPVVFGAFPSLHSACSVINALFLSWLFPKYVVVWWGYACWLWWSTMYLTHHYFFDLIGGAFLAITVFTYTKYMHLPVVDHTKFCRWSYTEIRKINVYGMDPLTFDYNDDLIYQNNDGYQGQIPTQVFSLPYLTTPQLSNYGQEYVELQNVSRSRQASRASFPQNSTNNSTNNSSSNSNNNSSNTTSNTTTNPPIVNCSFVNPSLAEDFHEVETGSFDNSATTSVFDENENQITTTNSNTSVDDFEPSQSYNPKFKKPITKA